MSTENAAKAATAAKADSVPAQRTAKDDESGGPSATAQRFIHYKDKDNVKQRLGANMPFVLYWCKGTGDWYYPVGLWENKDFSPKDGVDKSQLLQCRLAAADGDIDNQTIDGAVFEYRIGTGGSWSKPVQRKGQDYYIAHTGSSNSMQKINNWNIYEEEIRFALRFNISGAGDSWISENENTGSIRMRDSSGNRAWLVAVRYGTSWDDPFGSQGSFTKRSWSSDLSR